MNLKSLLILSLFAFSTIFTSLPSWAADAEEGFKPIFNGKDLDG